MVHAQWRAEAVDDAPWLHALVGRLTAHPRRRARRPGR
ncbi:MAG: hypothetical protein MZW92_42195 [Comamonadaceae bacterium]|nr:hypothetical protein [Comamonadaceae bacterium]